MRKYCETVLWVLIAIMLFAVSCAAGEEAPAVKKLAAGVKEIVLYANQAEPATMTITVEPEGASLEGLTLGVKKEGIITAEAQGNVIRVLPVSAGNTTLTVEAGKAKLNLPVKVLAPVTSVTLSWKDEVAAGKKIKFTPAFEPKNAGNKQVEWSLEGTELAEIDKNGTLSVSADCPPGTKLTVHCRALGSGIPVETVEEINVGIPLSKQERKGFEQLQELPVPGPLQHVSTDGSSWHEDFGMPEFAKVSLLLLEDNYLYVETDRDVAHIAIYEYDENWNIINFLTTERRERNKAGLQLTNPQKYKVSVTIFEDLEVNGKMEKDFSMSYILHLDPLSLKAEVKPMYSDADGEAWAPYQTKNKKNIRLRAEILPNGLTKYVHYVFEHKMGSLSLSASFNDEGVYMDAGLLRYSASGGISSNVRIDSTGEGSGYSISSDCYGFTMTRKNYDPTDKSSQYYANMYPGKNLDDPAVHIWNLELTINHEGKSKIFVTTENLFVHMEDGTVQMNTEIKDLVGNPFPWPFLVDLIGPNTFAYPYIAK